MISNTEFKFKVTKRSLKYMKVFYVRSKFTLLIQSIGEYMFWIDSNTNLDL